MVRRRSNLVSALMIEFLLRRLEADKEEEYFGEPRGDVVKFSRMMVDAGADLVLGHGPHVVRAMEYYKERLIAYSLGNFATWFGISVAGVKGYAPMLSATLDDEGRLLAA